MLKRLPSVNILLLRHLLCLLHLIARHSSENKMCSMNLAVCIGPSVLSSNSKISVDRREEVSKKVPKVICYLIDNWSTLFDPITTSDMMSSCPTRASTSSLNLDSTTPASQSSCEGTLSSSSSLTSTPSPVTTTITPTSISSPVSPPSYQETMAKMAQIAHHYHQKLQQQQLLLKQQQNQVLQTISPLVPVTVQPLVQMTAEHKVQQQVGQQSQPINYVLNNCSTTNNNNNHNNNNNVTTPKKVIQSTSSLSSSGGEEANEVVEKINLHNLNNGKFCSYISNSVTSNGDESGNSSSNDCSSNNSSTCNNGNTLGRGSKIVCVEQRCAKDMTAEDWRKDIHCSVAYLRTLFNGSSPKSTSDVTTPIKSSGMSLSQRDLNNSRSIQVSNEIDNQNNNNNTRKCLSTSRLMGERVSNFHHNHHTGIIPSSKSIITLVPIESSMTTPQTTTPTSSSFGCHPSQHKQQQQYHRRFIKNNNNHNLSNSNLMGNGIKNLSSSSNLRLAEKSNLMFRSSIDLASYKNSSSSLPCNNNTFNQNNHHHNHLVTNSNKNINNIINLFNSFNTVNSGTGNNDSYHRLSHPPSNGVNQNHSNSYNNNYLNNFNNNSYFNSKSNSRSGSISIYVSQNAINGKPGIVSIHNRSDSLSSFSGAEESYV